jgi:excisionase family DNA binding protein
MEADEYRAAIAALGLSQQEAGRALEVSRRTAHNFAVQGPSGPAAVAVRGMLKIAAYEALMGPAQPPICEMGTAMSINSYHQPEDQQRLSPLISTKELARLLNFSQMHVRRLAAAGKLPPPRAIGGRKLGWKTSDIRALLEGNAPKAYTAKYIWGGDSGSPLPFLNDDKAFIEKVDAE